MTVDELLEKLANAFPAFNARALSAWGSVFRANFARHEGEPLKAAYMAVLSSFSVAKSKALFPVPADFEPHLPGGHPKIRSNTPALDFPSHGDRTRRLMAEWREGQGRRESGGNPEIMLALEHMAEPLANLWGWAENPEPIRLTVKQILIVQQRAISSERRRRFGAMPRYNETWWDQIEQVAASWNIAVRWEDWGRGQKPERRALPPPAEPIDDAEPVPEWA
jgi:hypothetical protein